MSDLIDSNLEDTLDILTDLGFNINKNIDNILFKIIEFNKVDIIDFSKKEKVRNRLCIFGDFIRLLQNYHFRIQDPFHKILGKLFTRIWWIYNDSAEFV